MCCISRRCPGCVDVPGVLTSAALCSALSIRWVTGVHVWANVGEEWFWIFKEPGACLSCLARCSWARASKLQIFQLKAKLRTVLKSMEGSYAPLHPPLPYFSDSIVVETQRLFSESQCTVGRAGRPSCSPKSTHDFLICGWGAVFRQSWSGPKHLGEIEGSNPSPSSRLCQTAREGCRG